MVKLTTILNSSVAVQKTIALALLLLAGLVSIGVSYLIVTNFKASADQIVEKRQTLGRLESVASLRTMLENQSNSVAPAGISSDFLAGASEAVILADLQGRLNAMAAAHKVQVQSVGNLPIRSKDQIRYAGIATDVTGTDEAVHALLFDIETSIPYLVIRKVTLRSVSVGGIQAGQQVANGPAQLSARIEFFGALPPNSLEAGLQ